MTMGKVIRFEPSKRAKLATRDRTEIETSISKNGLRSLMAIGRLAKRACLALARVVLLTIFFMLITMLSLVGRSLRVFAQIGAVVVLISAGLEYLDHWQHLQLLLAAVGGLVLVTALLACHKHAQAAIENACVRLKGYQS
jgi:hypothetical protein